ncbi:MAG: LysR family transcriptional regulator [Vicinamibacterales bacterium]
MEFYQLESFLAVAKEGSFTRAGERVFRSQAAVSVAIRKLEEELGVELVVRDQECELTAAGLELLEHSRQLIALRDELQRTAREFASTTRGRVRIAAHASVAQYLLPAPLGEFHRRFPDVKIETRLCHIDEIATVISERRADLGFGLRQRDRKGLSSETLFTEPLVLIVALDSPLRKKAQLHVRDLSAQRFFIHNLQSATLSQVRDVFDQHDTPFHVFGELWNWETIKQFVAAGSGVAIVPFSVVQSDLDAARLASVPVAGFDIRRPIDVVFRESPRLVPAAAHLRDLLKEWKWAAGQQSAVLSQTK